MAVVQYSAIINQMRGKLGGSVFNKSRNSYTLQRKQQQPVGTRGRQSVVRNRFGQFQRSWKSLTNAQRVNWQSTAENNPGRDRFGNLTVLSGYNQFLKASMLATYAQVTPPTSPYVPPAPSAGVLEIYIYDVSFLQGVSGGVIMSGFLEGYATSATSDFAWIADISVPVSPGIMNYHGRWVNVGGGVMSNAIDEVLSANLGARYPVYVPGQVVYGRVRVVHIASGAIVYTSVDVVGVL